MLFTTKIAKDEGCKLTSTDSIELSITNIALDTNSQKAQCFISSSQNNQDYILIVSLDKNNLRAYQSNINLSISNDMNVCLKSKKGGVHIIGNYTLLSKSAVGEGKREVKLNTIKIQTCKIKTHNQKQQTSQNKLKSNSQSKGKEEKSMDKKIKHMLNNTKPSNLMNMMKEMENNQDDDQEDDSYQESQDEESDEEGEEGEEEENGKQKEDEDDDNEDDDDDDSDDDDSDDQDDSEQEEEEQKESLKSKSKKQDLSKKKIQKAQESNNKVNNNLEANKQKKNNQYILADFQILEGFQFSSSDEDYEFGEGEGSDSDSQDQDDDETPPVKKLKQIKADSKQKPVDERVQRRIVTRRNQKLQNNKQKEQTPVRKQGLEKQEDEVESDSYDYKVPTQLPNFVGK